jgi:hypothetical protein
MEIIDKYVPEFTNYLTQNKQLINFDNYFLLCSEENITMNNNPFIAQLIYFYLKLNTFNVILISTQESLHHYSQLAKKFGINLNNNDKFSYIDLFYSPLKKVMKDELPLAETYPYTYNTNRSKFYYANYSDLQQDEINFELVVEDIVKQLEKFPNKELNKVVIMDNISSLLIREEKLQDSLNYLFKKIHIEFQTNLILNLNKEISEDIYIYLYNLADLEMEFKQNESGFSKDMDGNVKISLKTQSSKEWNLRYYIKENGMHFFPHLII